jgi:hypothetical protein
MNVQMKLRKRIPHQRWVADDPPGVHAGATTEQIERFAKALGAVPESPKRLLATAELFQRLG